MWFINYHKSDSIFLPDTAEAFYVDGAYVTAVTLFLLALPILTIGLYLFGMLTWLCSHLVIFILAHLVLLIVMTIIQTRHSRKKHMIFYCAAMLFIFAMPILGSLIYIFPVAFYGEILGAIFAILLIYGGAYLCFSISKLFKSGISCFIAAVIYAGIALAIIFGFRAIDAERLAAFHLTTFYSFWA